ncbi:MAG: hypothetical protein A2Y40_05700 [Candidatus Margulisbacteria bacterium GWF2_35_9]|nr:MAG: hypothetical protein A2Y40_05700 [Candidatus Margulisbacteria bacterium GWF2_35_9]
MNTKLISQLISQDPVIRALKTNCKLIDFIVLTLNKNLDAPRDFFESLSVKEKELVLILATEIYSKINIEKATIKKQLAILLSVLKDKTKNNSIEMLANHLSKLGEKSEPGANSLEEFFAKIKFSLIIEIRFIEASMKRHEQARLNRLRNTTPTPPPDAVVVPKIKKIAKLVEKKATPQALTNARINLETINQRIIEKGNPFANVTIEGVTFNKEKATGLVAALLHKNSRINSFDLIRSHSTDEAIDILSELIEHDDCNLTHFGIMFGLLGDLEIKMLIESIKIGNKLIQSLNFSGNLFGNDGAQYIAEALTDENLNIKNVNLSKCKIADIGAFALLAAFENVNCKVKTLALSGNNFSREVKQLLKATCEKKGIMLSLLMD